MPACAFYILCQHMWLYACCTTGLVSCKPSNQLFTTFAFLFSSLVHTPLTMSSSLATVDVMFARYLWSRCDYISQNMHSTFWTIAISTNVSFVVLRPRVPLHAGGSLWCMWLHACICLPWLSRLTSAVGHEWITAFWLFFSLLAECHKTVTRPQTVPICTNYFDCKLQTRSLTSENEPDECHVNTTRTAGGGVWIVSFLCSLTQSRR